MIRKRIGLVIAALMADAALGWSDPVNTSITEFKNLTKADNIVEVAVEMNNWLDGLFGAFILAGIGVVTFMIARTYSDKFWETMSLTSFIVSIMAVFFRIMGWVNDKIMLACFGILIISIGITIASRQ